MDDYIKQICEKLSTDPNTIIINSYKSNKKITYYQLIESLLLAGSTTKAASYLEVTYRTVGRAVEKLKLPKLSGGNETYKYVLLSLIEKKECKKCSSIKDLEDFCSSISNNSLNKNSYCKTCQYKTYSNWYKKNSDIHNQKITARKRNFDSILSKSDKDYIFNRDGFKCVSCNLDNEEHLITWGTNLHLDHIIPVSKNGKNIISNLQLLCVTCNSRKSNKMPS